ADSRPAGSALTLIETISVTRAPPPRYRPVRRPFFNSPQKKSGLEAAFVADARCATGGGRLHLGAHLMTSSRPSRFGGSARSTTFVVTAP
ncbi:hypothetical protein, partial [Mesorhizobium sp. M1C.F.Ca.ET.204.01.1.1]|uniref:hypothetical protein n=1 Tax=Mesorhizobium sp. M1C.F.Ca.ET.204.01.1.1 TaxID=2563929 RepID=UPI001AEE7779